MLQGSYGRWGSNARGGLTESGDLMLEGVLRKVGI
jgi:hypothetical protein